LIEAFDPVPHWYPPFEGEMINEDEFPMHAVTQRPMAMYHAWGSQNQWLRQILGRNWLYIAHQKAASLGIKDGDWVTLTSHHGQIRAQAKLMNGVNADTVWTWNAIGKRSGTWGLEKGVPESKQGFLLNHLISELLPEREGGYRFSNSDPVTGQAAWYDLRVRLEKATDANGMSAPQFPDLKPLRAAQ
jgi:anaerobic selenocysteine-containing dehydrogenase